MEIREDPDLLPCEKETTININKKNVSEDNLISISSSQRPIIRYLLDNEEFIEENREVKEIDGITYIVGITGKIPINYLKLKSVPRKSEYISEIV